MHRLIARAARLILAVMLMAPLAAAQETPERSRTQGLKETDRFVKAGGKTSDAVEQAKLQTQKTLDAYNALVTKPSTNMKGDYKKVMKSADSMNDRVAGARQTLAEMQKAGDVYFNGRAETIKNIKDPKLLEQARQRLGDSQKEFAGVLKSLKEAGDALEPFRKDLADQITFLGSDLTPSAMTALKPSADKLNGQGAELFARTDKAIASANTYFQGLKPLKRERRAGRLALGETEGRRGSSLDRLNLLTLSSVLAESDDRIRPWQHDAPAASWRAAPRR